MLEYSFEYSLFLYPWDYFFWAFSCALSYLRIWEDGELDIGSQGVVQHRGDHAGQVGQQLALGALQDCRHFDYFLGLLWPDMAHFLLKCVFWFSWLINLEWNLHIWAEENHNHSKTHHFNDICLLIIDIQIPQPYHLWPVHQQCQVNLKREKKFGAFF